MRFRSTWPVAALFLHAFAGWGQEKALTFEEALSLARERGAAVALAKGRTGEALARREQAGRRFQENPVLEIDGGPRSAADGSFDFAAALSQGLYSARLRSARLAGAQAVLERAESELEEARRAHLREVGAAFLQALAERDRMALQTRSRRAADELLAATERRYEAGEATALELNRARTVAAAARAALSATEAEAEGALAGLKALLGLPAAEAVEVRGALAAPFLEIEPLLARLDERPDLRALAAELREAQAEALLGEALSRPEWGVRGGIAREEDAEILTAGFVVSLPVHNRGQETLAVGRARAEALRQALASARAAAEAEVRGRHATLLRRLAAVRELEATALPALDDSESLALKSFEAGEIGLGDLLLIRREILETRLSHLDRLLEASLTRLELEAAAGALR